MSKNNTFIVFIPASFQATWDAFLADDSDDEFNFQLKAAQEKDKRLKKNGPASFKIRYAITKYLKDLHLGDSE